VIVTLTLNPSLDRTMEVDRLRRGGVTRAASVHFDPGGKGVNVTRALRAFGVGSRAVIPCGGPDGGELVRMLGEAGVPVVEVPVAGRTRSNVTLVEDGGRSTKVNAPGDPLTGEELAALADAVLAACGAGTRSREAFADETPGGIAAEAAVGTVDDAATEAATADAAGDVVPGTTASWVVLCGSLPPGVPDGVYASLTTLFAAHGVRVAVDTSGPALALAVAAGPDLVKPNREELAAAAGRPLHDLADVVAAAEQLRDAGARAVLASLGPDGAVLVDAKGAVFCTADPVEPRSTVGAGDAMLAGFLAADAAGKDGPEALAEAVAWGRAAVSLPGSRMPGPEDVSREGIRVLRDLDGGRGRTTLSASEGT
jgi:1-phosphofructokinase